jgi:HSP20 family protein
MQDQPDVVVRLRELRLIHTLTQEELGRALGLSRQSVNALEAGRWLPSLPVALQIASFFGVPLSHVFCVPVQNRQLLPASTYEEPAIEPVTQLEEESMTHLTPWSPLREMRSMLDELMDESSWPSHMAVVSAPAVNITQSAESIEVAVRAPGYKKDEITLEVGDEFLTVSGEAKNEQVSEDRHYIRREFASQQFSRTIPLPSPVAHEGAKAEMRDGILYVTMQKVKPEGPKTSTVAIQ